MSSGVRALLSIVAALMLVLGAPATPATAAGTGDGQLEGPIDVAADAAGNVYVADGAQIQKFTSDGTFLTKWGSYGAGDGQFESPWNIAADPVGNLYVADANGNRIQKFTSDGTFLTKWGALGRDAGEFDSPEGLAIDLSGNVYVADANNARIEKFTASGTFIGEFGAFGSLDGEFYGVAGLATDAAGNVYVADTNNARIDKFTSTGGFVTKWGRLGSGYGEFNFPSGVATDAVGNVYVADLNNARIEKFTTDGTFVAGWGSHGGDDGQFDLPNGVATDPVGNVYVADSGNDRIQKFTSDGTFITAWGDGSAAAPARPTITASPKAKTTKRAATFRFSSAQAGAGFQCKLTGTRVPKALRRWRSCDLPQALQAPEARQEGLLGPRPARRRGGQARPPRLEDRPAPPKRLAIPTTARKARFRVRLPPRPAAAPPGSDQGRQQDPRPRPLLGPRPQLPQGRDPAHQGRPQGRLPQAPHRGEADDRRHPQPQARDGSRWC